MALEHFLDKDSQRRVVEAIGVAEKNTSGEVRVHVESICKCGNPYERAVEVFNNIEMYKTEARNGVLIYIAYESRMFAIIGDEGINNKVGIGFWEQEKELLTGYLKQGRQCDGLCEVIKMVGERLSEYFPYQTNDVNELSDEISYEEN